MSWSVGAVGKPQAVRNSILEQFSRASVCMEPEETIRQSAKDVLEKALDSMTNNFSVRVIASGSQSYKNYSKPEDGVCNSLDMKIEILHGFVE